MATLIVDKREKEYFTSLMPKYIVENNKKYKNWQVEIQKMTIPRGDFAISFEGKTQVIIERKTWKDLAGSLGGRFEKQRDELQKISAVCKVLYLIEGGTKYNPETNAVPVSRFCKARPPKITYKQLEGVLRDMLLDGIPYVITENPEHSCRFLVKLARDVVRKNYTRADEVKKMFGELLDMEKCEELEKNANLRNDNINTEKIETNEFFDRMQIWSNLKGVGSKTATALDKNFKLKDFIKLADPEALKVQIASTPHLDTGRKVGAKAANKIVDNITISSLLLGVKGVSKNNVSHIAKCDFTNAETFAESFKKIKINNRKLSKPLCAHICKLLFA